MTEQATSSEPLKIVVVDQSKDAFDTARDRADERLNEELAEGGRFRQFVQGIWKGNIAKEYYRQKYTRHEVNEQQRSQDVFIDSPADARTAALEATIQRFQLDSDEVIHEEAGEKKEIHDDSSEITNGLKDLVRQYCEGTLNDQTLHEERTRFLQAYRETHGEEAIGSGIVTTDNILQIAQAVKGSVQHGEDLDAAIDKIEVITGEARNGARTEARYNAIDTIIDKLSKSKIGSLVGPEVIVGAVTLAASIAKWGSQSVVGAVTKTLLPGVAAGAWAGLRENKRFKDERAQHMRETTKGSEFEETAERRAELETTRYETQTAQSLTDHLNVVSSDEFFEDGGEAALRAALEAIAAVETRSKLSDQKNIDLITFESATTIGDERMRLDLARAAAKHALDGRLTGAHRVLLGFTEDTPLQEVINAHSEVFIESIEADIEQKDELFQKLKRMRVAKAAAIGVVTGIVGGVIIQEGIAAVDGTRVGLFEQVWGGNDAAIPVDQLGVVEQHQTVLHGLVEGDQTVVHTGPSVEYGDHSLADNSELSISNDHMLVDNNDGTFSLVDPNGVATAENIPINDDGSLPAESMALLDSLGMTVIDNSFSEEVVTQVQQEVAANQFVQNNIAETTSVRRELWYGNDTPGVYDQNELRVFRGGSADAPGIVGDGFQYSVAGMQPGGSWQGGESVDWNQAAAGGNLFMAVSATVETQSQVFMVPIGPDGAVNIEAGDPAWNFFANENGSVAFNGAYAEIVQTTGVDENGVVGMRPLATMVGDRSVGAIVDTITTSTIEHHANYEITTAGYETLQTNFTEMAPVTPIESRRGLETPRPKRPLGAYYYNAALTEQERQAILSEVSPRLRANGEAVLNPQEELDWFRKELNQRLGVEYVNSLDSFIDNDPALNRISAETSSIVIIPVAAASESKNIYSTLSLFAQQDRGVSDTAVVLLNVNWLDTALQDPEKAANIQKTLAEIERARTDFPQLAISVMQKQYNQAEVEATGGVIGYVAQDLANTALMTVQKSIASGKIPGDQDVLIVRSDADLRGVSRKQLANFERAVSENRDVDIFKGVTRFGVEKQRQLPGFGIVTAFSNALTIASTQENHVHTGGANFAIRASTYAAIGGLGKLTNTGPGSDDVHVGLRASVARRIDTTGASYYQNSPTSSAASQQTRRIKLVSGAAIDTDASRLTPFYLAGKSYQAAWNDAKGSFGDGPGSYRERTEDVEVVDRAGAERTDQSSFYDAIEANISAELGWANKQSSKRVLALFFGSVPGAYTITGTIGEGNVRFKLTVAGRKFIKNRTERETNGTFGTYGARKMRQLYGIVAPGAKRQPAGESAPLVSRLV